MANEWTLMLAGFGTLLLSQATRIIPPLRQTSGGSGNTGDDSLLFNWPGLDLGGYDWGTGSDTSATDEWVPPTPSGRERAAPYLTALRQIGNAYGLPSGMLTRVAWQESRFRPDIINGQTRSSAGAVGMFQWTAASAADPGYGVTPVTDRTDWHQSANSAAQYLAALRDRTDSWSEALAAYNWGLGNVYKYGINSTHTPSETRNYYASITNDLGIA